MSKNDETVKLMAETLKAGMTKFVGNSDPETARKTVIANMRYVLGAFQRIADINAPLPDMVVYFSTGNEARVCLFDPKTKKEIEVGEWISRASEGFYD